jgi:hypothetical protein
MGVHGEATLTGVFKSRQSLPIRELGALHVKILIGLILLASSGGWSVSIRHTLGASQKRYMR